MSSYFPFFFAILNKTCVKRNGIAHMQIVNNFARELYSPYAFSLRAANKLIKNYSSSPNGLCLTNPWVRRPNGLMGVVCRALSLSISSSQTEEILPVMLFVLDLTLNNNPTKMNLYCTCSIIITINVLTINVLSGLRPGEFFCI